MEEFPQKTIPDYIEAVENPDDVRNPGTIVRLRLRNVRLPGVEVEDIESMRICRWPGNKDARWSWEMEPIDMGVDTGVDRDSCVALYWAYQAMKPGEERRMAFTYGLSALELADRPKPGESVLALSVPSSVLPNSDFVVTAYLWRTKPGQKVTLKFLDEGLTLADGEKSEKPVDSPGLARTQVSWKVKAGANGALQMEVTSGGNNSKPRTVKVGTANIFD